MMRKYLLTAPHGNMDARVPGDSHHWDLLAALLRGSASGLGLEILAPLYSAMLRRDVQTLLSVAALVDSDPQLYDQSVEHVRFLKQAICLLKKFPFSEQEYPHDRRAAAIQKWLDAEDQCAKTNARLKECSREQLPKWVPLARELIARVLGDLTPSLVMQMITNGQHGPGSTLNNNGGRVTAYYKFADLPYTVSASAAHYAYAAISSSPQWMNVLERSGLRDTIPPAGAPQYQKELMLLERCVVIADSDKVDFVPKDARTDRPIGIGASMNMYMQLGVKTYIQSQLKMVGIDLSDQSRNQELAYQGSRYAYLSGLPNPSQFSTIDLASASDTLSKGIVQLLLPTEWFAFLDDLRHKSSVVDGTEFVLNKFCAMGNGFTFPLESLVFWAVAKAAIQSDGAQCKRQDIAVYGDDIIVRYKHAGTVLEALRWSGFLINEEKSFLAGHFKESCGADFYRGRDVRPFYLKRRIETYGDCYFICNSIANRIMRSAPHRGLQECYRAALRLVPPSHRNYVPLYANIESGLYVPLAYLRSIGRQPYLSADERAYLSNLKDHEWISDLQVGVYWSQGYVPKTYKGSSVVRLMLALFYDSDIVEERVRMNPFLTKEDIQHMVAASSGQVTRRKSMAYFVKRAPCSNWHGSLPEKALTVHPIYWM